MNRILSTAFALLALAPCAFSQNYTTVKTTSEKALTAFNEGRLEAKKGMETAIVQGYFEKAAKADPKFFEAKVALADTYVEMRNFFKAKTLYAEALALDSAYAPIVFYFLAEVEWELDQFDECATHVELYLLSKPTNPYYKKKAEQLLPYARFTAEALKHPVPFNPQSVGTGINTASADYFPSLTADGQTMIFTRRDSGDENFYSSEKKDGVWQKAEPLEGVNTVENEGAQAISPDGTWLVFTACDRRGDGSLGECDLYWSQLKSTGWTKAAPFSAAINSTHWEAQPTIGADNKTLVFSSLRPGGRGKRDLWMTVRQPGGKWSKPENLGPNINTGGDDQTPFLHPDGQTLYFTSDSLPGMGGNDLYMARRQPDGSWSRPQNLGYPINTKGHEVMLTVSLDGRTAYYATDRPGGQGSLDIYQFDLPEHARPQPVTYARARVADAVTGSPIVAKVDFIDLKTGQSYVSANTKSDGTTLVCLPAGKDYALNVSKDKYLFYSENFNLTETATFEKPFTLDIDLQPIMSEGGIAAGSKPVVLRNVFFETGSASLRPESAAELDRLANLLTEVPTLKIQINGHTDNVGDDTFNQKLSEARAKAVYDYLVSKNIPGERLKFKGFGELKPMETNDTPEGRGRNRRTEFEVW